MGLSCIELVCCMWHMQGLIPSGNPGHHHITSGFKCYVVVFFFFFFVWPTFHGLYETKLMLHISLLLYHILTHKNVCLFRFIKLYDKFFLFSYF